MCSLSQTQQELQLFSKEAFQQVIKTAIEEDAGFLGDITSRATIDEQQKSIGSFRSKADGIVAGIEVAHLVFKHLDPKIDIQFSEQDGNYIKKGQIFGKVQGNTRSILQAERVALNIMQRMSGIATLTNQMVNKIGDGKSILLDTRKTAPGLRVLDKTAVRIGGGQNHRYGLFDMILIKDNHITSSGSIKEAFRRAVDYLKQIGKEQIEIEIEARTLQEVQEVLLAQDEIQRKVDRVLLDNMTKINDDGTIDVSMLQEALQLVNGKIKTEASGNVTIETIGQIARTGVNYISSGALTHSVNAQDISFDIDPL